MTEPVLPAIPKAAHSACQTAASGGRLRVPFGLTLEDGVLHAPRQVPLGDACGCVCPDCRAPLTAKHAMSGGVIPHFAHARGSDCASGFETAVHFAAKQLIERERQVFLPVAEVLVERVDELGRYFHRHAVLAPASPRQLEDVRLELWCETFRPDILATPVGEGPIGIEIAVTSFVGEEKLERLRAQARPTVEFDLRHLRDYTWDTLREALLEGQASARWVFHPELDTLEARLTEEVLKELAASRVAYARARARTRASGQDPLMDPDVQRAALVETSEKLRRTKAQSRAAAFRERAWADKAQLVCRGFGVSELPEVLRWPTTYESSFNVDEDPAVWQAALFGGLVHHAAARNEPEFTLDEAMAWMFARFDVLPVLRDNARAAVGAYLYSLSERGALWRKRQGEYHVRVASLTAFETLRAYREYIARDYEGLRWATASEWPTLTTAKNILTAHAGAGLPSPAWRMAASLSRRDCAESITEMRARRTTTPLSRGEVLAYWICAGFVQCG